MNDTPVVSEEEISKTIWPISAIFFEVKNSFFDSMCTREFSKQFIHLLTNEVRNTID